MIKKITYISWYSL